MEVLADDGGVPKNIVLDVMEGGWMSGVERLAQVMGLGGGRSF